jgi:hypothetical protein
MDHSWLVQNPSIHFFDDFPFPIFSCHYDNPFDQVKMAKNIKMINHGFVALTEFQSLFQYLFNGPSPLWDEPSAEEVEGCRN